MLCLRVGQTAWASEVRSRLGPKLPVVENINIFKQICILRRRRDCNSICADSWMPLFENVLKDRWPARPIRSHQPKTSLWNLQKSSRITLMTFYLPRFKKIYFQNIWALSFPWCPNRSELSPQLICKSTRHMPKSWIASLREGFRKRQSRKNSACRSLLLGGYPRASMDAIFQEKKVSGNCPREKEPKSGGKK